MLSYFARARTLINQGNRLGRHHPEIYTSVVASAGTLAWGAFVAGRKAYDSQPYQEDMSAVTGNSPLVREARERVYDMDDHLSYRS